MRIKTFNQYLITEEINPSYLIQRKVKKLDDKTDLFLSSSSLTKTEKNFIQALEYVKKHYPELYTLPTKITASDHFNKTKGAIYQPKYKNILVNTGSNNNNSFTVSWFVNALVHELTHAKQHVDGKSIIHNDPELEKEAYAAGRQAASKYK